jgi:membrane-associated phospholipid phosphatase
MRETKSLQALQIGAACFVILSAMMVGFYITGAFTAADRVAFEWIEAVRRDWLTALLNVITNFGDAIVVVPLALAIVIGCFRKGHRTEALTLLFTLLGAWLMNEWMKAYFERPRPEGVNIIELPDSYAFPSGHSMIGPAFFLMLAFLLKSLFQKKSWSWLLQPAGIVMALLLPVSRLYLGVHYLSDVLAGFCIAMSIYFLGRVVYHRRQRRRSEIVSSHDSTR